MDEWKVLKAWRADTLQLSIQRSRHAVTWRVDGRTDRKRVRRADGWTAGRHGREDVDKRGRGRVYVDADTDVDAYTDAYVDAYVDA